MEIEQFGKVPPQAVEVEEAVLGACMIEADCISEVSTILKPCHFYKQAHELIFSAMIRLFVAGKPIDLLTVTEDLKSTGSLDRAGGPFYVAQLTHKVGSAANAEAHAYLIKERWINRALIEHSSKVIKSAFEDTTDAMNLLEMATKGIDDIQNEVHSSEQKDFYGMLTKQVQDIMISINKPEEEKHVLGLATGLYSLDRKILGWNAPDLIVVSGRPMEGKTSFAIQSADAIMNQGEPVGFISAEMELSQLNLKLLSLNTDIDISRLRKGNINPDELERLERAHRRMANYRFQVHDKPVIPEDARALAKMWKKKFGIKALFFDYIQRSKIPKRLMGAPRNDQISAITNNLKDIALELEMPVIALSQMSRDIERRTGESKRPQLADLRDGGSIEQDADIVLFVFRPEIHGIKAFADGSPTANCTEFIIAKHRLGTRGAVVAKFIGSGNRFDDTGENSNQGPSVDTGNLFKENNSAPAHLAEDDDTPF